MSSCIKKYRISINNIPLQLLNNFIMIYNITAASGLPHYYRLYHTYYTD